MPSMRGAFLSALLLVQLATVALVEAGTLVAGGATLSITPATATTPGTAAQLVSVKFQTPTGLLVGDTIAITFPTVTGVTTGWAITAPAIVFQEPAGALPTATVTVAGLVVTLTTAAQGRSD